MPSIVINDAKGLFQQSGSGISIASSGMAGSVVSSELTVASDQTAVEVSLSMPAGALLTDLIWLCTSNCVAGAGGANGIQVFAGDATTTADIVAATLVAKNSGDVAANAAVSTAGSNLLVTGGAVIAFADEAPLYSSSAWTVFASVKPQGANAATPGKFKVIALYTIL